jgi:hypothetical protein
MSSWNYRIVKSRVGSQVRYGIHEVYYTAKGKPVTYTADAIAIDVFNQEMTRPSKAEALTTLLVQLELMREAFDKPVLTSADFKTKRK